jgi:hypothetical protein
VKKSWGSLKEDAMIKTEDLQPQYIINEAGEKTSVILPLATFQELMEDLEDLAVVAERRDEPTIPIEQLLAELKKDGLILDRVEKFGDQGTERA